LINEVELAIIYAEVFNRLGIKGWSLQINHRKVLKGIMEVAGVEAKEKSILITIDKTDKIGIDSVKTELEKDIEPKNLEKLLSAYTLSGSTSNKISFLKNFLKDSKVGMEGISDIEFLFNHSSIRSFGNSINLDLTLARGLEYYTGVIFEAKAPDTVKIGSIGGGGRYDDLTGLFGVPDLPGVGISFGVDRIYDVMEELGLFPQGVHTGTKVLFFNLGKEEAAASFELVQQLRNNGVSAELFHELAKFDKQFKYAEKKNIPYVAIIGSSELSEKQCTVKDTRTGKQEKVEFGKLIEFFK
jgi:histidyl-tRNA synthetase